MNLLSFPWWEWFLIAAGFGLLAAITHALASAASEKNPRGAAVALPAIICVIAWWSGAISAIIGLIRLIKAIWEA